MIYSHTRMYLWVANALIRQGIYMPVWVFAGHTWYKVHSYGAGQILKGNNPDKEQFNSRFLLMDSLKGKNLLPEGANSFLLESPSIWKEGANYFRL